MSDVTPPPEIIRVGTARIPTQWGDFDCTAYRSTTDDVEHLVFSMGDIATGAPVLVRVHSECLTGDVFASRRCDCGAQLHSAMSAIATAGNGALVYLRGHEGRGIGIGHKIRAYALQDDGLDTVDANTELGLPVDSREYTVAARILADLGVTHVRLITNNPLKHEGLDGFGITVVDRVPSSTTPTPENIEYLRTKRDRLGHVLQIPGD